MNRMDDYGLRVIAKKLFNFQSIIPMKLELLLGIIDQQAKWQILSALVPR